MKILMHETSPVYNITEQYGIHRNPDFANIKHVEQFLQARRTKGLDLSTEEWEALDLRTFAQCPFDNYWIYDTEVHCKLKARSDKPTPPSYSSVKKAKVEYSSEINQHYMGAFTHLQFLGGQLCFKDQNLFTKPIFPQRSSALRQVFNILDVAHVNDGFRRSAKKQYNKGEEVKGMSDYIRKGSSANIDKSSVLTDITKKGNWIPIAIFSDSKSTNPYTQIEHLFGVNKAWDTAWLDALVGFERTVDNTYCFLPKPLSPAIIIDSLGEVQPPICLAPLIYFGEPHTVYFKSTYPTSDRERNTPPINPNFPKGRRSLPLEDQDTGSSPSLGYSDPYSLSSYLPRTSYSKEDTNQLTLEPKADTIKDLANLFMPVSYRDILNKVQGCDPSQVTDWLDKKRQSLTELSPDSLKYKLTLSLLLNGI